MQTQIMSMLTKSRCFCLKNTESYYSPNACSANAVPMAPANIIGTARIEAEAR